MQLASFTRRNSGRQLHVEIEEVARGVSVEESGFVLLGAAYDPRLRNIKLILGDCEHAVRRVTRTIGAVDAVTVTADPMGEDVGLRISHGGGQTVLTLPVK